MNESDNRGLNKHPGVTAKSYKKGTYFIVALILIAFVGGCIYLIKETFYPKTGNTTNTNTVPLNASYRLKGNDLNNFDLVFMQLENNGKNKVYSPLSIKYALEMLAEGADGQTKEQLDFIIGEYVAKTYNNNKNMSFANAMFIKNSSKDSIVSNYKDYLKTKYNAEILYDSFEKPDNLNGWISTKTLNLINNMFDNSISNYDYFLVNALAIDMEWNYQLQCEMTPARVPCIRYSVHYAHENYSDYVPEVWEGMYSQVKFNNNDEVNAAVIGASINRYDIINDLGENNIRQTVGAEYQKYIDEGGETCDVAFNDYIDNYINELNSNYKKIDKSTDFSFYTDEDIKVFAKDLKTYNGTTLQYVAVMPVGQKLVDYVKDLKAEDINTLISQLKEVKYDSFEEGYVTKITGSIPLFKFDYALNLMDDLKQLGINDVFDPNKANLSKLTTTKGAYIATALHKATIDFSNDGIKAAAVTVAGGAGSAGDCYVTFDYKYEVPVKEIDVTFDNPYLYIIRDKASGEVWFAGTVYNPSK